MRTRRFAVIIIWAVLLVACGGAEPSEETQIPPPPQGQSVGDTQIPLPPEGHMYHGAFPGGITDWGEEDDMTPEDVRSYEEHAGKPIAWLYFSHNWFRGHEFPLEMASWIRDQGSIPFIRLMLRSDAEQNHSEPKYTLDDIIGGEFDDDLHAWAGAARDFTSPLLVEFGTEVNGEWFSWNGSWNGGGETDDYGAADVPDGPERFQDAYRHIIQITWDEGVENITWVFHIDADDVPGDDWNRFENYYPGSDWIDWLGISVYGTSDPMDDECRPFRDSMDAAIPRLEALGPGMPIVVLEFGAAANNPYCDQVDWAREALENLTSSRWPSVVGFAWWNENWQNDDDPEHDTVLRIEDSPGLADVFQELVGDQDTVLGTIKFEERVSIDKG